MNKKHRLMYNLLLKSQLQWFADMYTINSTGYVKEIKVHIPIYHAMQMLAEP